MNPEQLVTLTSQETTKTTGAATKGPRSQSEDTFTGQSWDDLSNKINNIFETITYGNISDILRSTSSW